MNSIYVNWPLGLALGPISDYGILDYSLFYDQLGYFFN